MMEYPSHPQHAQQYLRHDAETFRVAEELMMLSNCAVTSSVGSADSYTQHHAGDKLRDEQQYSAGSHEQMQPVKTTSLNIKREQPQKNRKRPQKVALNVTFDAVHQQSTKQTNNNRHEDSEQLTRSAPGTSNPHSPDILNSRCDVSHSQLLKEHRSRFRQVRRRLTIEQRSKNRAYLDRFHVQGIPLVQHLESLSHWR
ncbi:hypothetical protein Gpo141_00000234 [Globisporangium polare]